MGAFSGYSTYGIGRCVAELPPRRKTEKTNLMPKLDKAARNTFMGAQFVFWLGAMYRSDRRC